MYTCMQPTFCGNARHGGVQNQHDTHMAPFSKLLLLCALSAASGVHVAPTGTAIVADRRREQPVLLAAAKPKQGTKKKEVKKAVTKNAQNPLQAIWQRVPDKQRVKVPLSPGPTAKIKPTALQEVQVTKSTHPLTSQSACPRRPRSRSQASVPVLLRSSRAATAPSQPPCKPSLPSRHP